MPRVESRYVFPYIIENMKWKKKNLMKLNCAKYCILCMSSSDLWGHDLLRRFKGFCQKGMKGQAGRQKAPVFSHDANFCKHDGMVHHIFIIQRSDNFKYFFYSKAHTHINISKLYTSHPLYFKGYQFCGKLCDGAMIFNSLQMSIKVFKLPSAQKCKKYNGQQVRGTIFI